MEFDKKEVLIPGGLAIGILASTVWLHSRIAELEANEKNMVEDMRKLKTAIQTLSPTISIASETKRDVERIKNLIAEGKKKDAKSYSRMTPRKVVDTQDKFSTSPATSPAYRKESQEEEDDDTVEESLRHLNSGYREEF